MITSSGVAPVPASLPSGDRTPIGDAPLATDWRELLKRPLRKAIYPSYLRLINPVLSRKFDPNDSLAADQWYWGYRGWEPQFLRGILNRHVAISGRSILLVGCGTGRAIDSWMKFRPRYVLGLDLFDYTRAWRHLLDMYGQALGFVQGDITEMPEIYKESFDIVASDAVLEHITNVPRALGKMYQILRPGGTFYATFGPLWHSWGGDHFSGYDHADNGYNHLLLERKQYSDYLAAKGEFRHSEDDGRTWILNGLFSYLKINEYLAAIEQGGFERKYLGVVIDPQAIRWMRRHSDLRQQLLRRASEMDLLVSAILVIAIKVDGSSICRTVCAPMSPSHSSR